MKIAARRPRCDDRDPAIGRPEALWIERVEAGAHSDRSDRRVRRSITAVGLKGVVAILPVEKSSRTTLIDVNLEAVISDTAQNCGVSVDGVEIKCGL